MKYAITTTTMKVRIETPPFAFFPLFWEPLEELLEEMPEDELLEE